MFNITAVNGNNVSIYGDLKYVHWGQFYEGVDMRAEVGMLNRKIKIHGEMQKACYGEEINFCSHDKEVHDNFGGHTKAEFNFR